MEPDVSIESGSRIRVLVAAVGSIPTVNLRGYIELLDSHSQIDLSSISSFYTEHQKSPFTLQPWDNGIIRFRFIIGNANRSSQWDDFQAHRKIHGIIGIVHCPLNPDLDSAYDSFTDLCNDYPAVQIRRCFAFYPSDKQMEEQEEDKKRQNMVLFPPVDKQMLKHHMQTIMCEFTASLLMAFESRVLLAEQMGAILTTPMDSHVSLSSEEVSKAKRRRLERVQKAMGDYSLLAGSPSDAISHYSTAIELSRHTGDSFWNAGAIEGSICALVVDPGVESSILVEDEVRYKYYEVITLYRRCSAYLFEVEAELKLARFLCREERGNELAKEVSDLLSSAVEAGRNLTDVNDQVVLFVEVARIFGTLGFERKSAFFTRQVAQYYQVQDDAKSANAALQILLLAAKSYGVNSNKSIKNDDNEETVMEVSPSWNALQINILGDILTAAVKAGDALVAWRSAARLLRNHYPFINPNSQASLLAALNASSARLPPGTRSSEPALPFIRLLSLPQRPSHGEIIRKVPGKKEWWIEQSSSSGPFIYTPLKGTEYSSSKGTTWIVDETVEVIVAVANPCSFQVLANGISLSVEGISFEAFPVSLSLPPNTTQTVTLSGIPREAGSAFVRGCFVEFAGVITEHLFDSVESLVLSSEALVDPFRGGDFKQASLPTNAENILVLPPLPLLSVHVNAGDGDIVMYEGEIRKISIHIKNISSVPVLDANLTLTSKQRENILVDHEALQRALPLEPNGSVSIPVEIRAGLVKPDSKPGVSPLMLLHYAGPDEGECPVGRQLTVPLQVQVKKGLGLVHSRLLCVEVPSTEKSTVMMNTAESTTDNEVGDTTAKIDPYRGRWSLRVLELELFNPADVAFHTCVTVDDEEACPSTRIDPCCGSRLLIPLEKLKLPNNVFEEVVSRKEIDQAGSKVKLRWEWGRNCVGEVNVAESIKHMLQESIQDIPNVNPLTFGFRLGEGGRIHAHELMCVEMLVRNNTKENAELSLSVTCRDVALNSNVKESILWAGVLNGIYVNIPASGEHVHRFSLCFLIPGEYILIGAAVNKNQADLCYSGPPFRVHVES